MTFSFPHKLIVLMFLLPLALTLHAQTGQCEIVDIINYPIDTNTFQMVQDYGVASPRHQGRLHTGEDWHGGVGQTIGQPVRAAANGRVTYSSPRGWGRDGGVIIIEHTLPDERIIYTQYGHIGESNTVTFPARLSCVQAGDVIAVIADARPAPHLHFEVRVSQPDVPGPGYLRGDLEDEGWRRPSQVISSIQTQLHRAYEWHVALNTYGPQVEPLVLNTNEMLLIDGSLLRRVTNDGRVLWRQPLQSPAVGIEGYQGNPLITYRDGTLGFVDFDGIPGESWRLEFTPSKRLPDLGLSALYYTDDEALVALSPDRREILWRLDDVIPFENSYVSGSLIALWDDTTLQLVSFDGQQVDEADLRDGVSLATAPDGDLLAYTYGGLWKIDENGEWTEAVEGVERGGGSSAVAATSDGRIYLMTDSSLFAYTAEGVPAWQATLPNPVTGRAIMRHYDGVLLILSTHGDIITLRDSGGICGFASMYGDDLARLWHELSEDGTLRVAIGDRITGFDWERLTNAC